MKNLTPNKRVLATGSTALLISLSLSVLAGCGMEHASEEHDNHSTQTGHHDKQHHDAESNAPVAASNGLSDTVMATIVSIDTVANRITLDHGLLQNIGMEAMTMGFALDAGVSVEGLKPNDKVRATIEMQPDKGFVVTAISDK